MCYCKGITCVHPPQNKNRPYKKQNRQRLLFACLLPNRLLLFFTCRFGEQLQKVFKSCFKCKKACSLFVFYFRFIAPTAASIWYISLIAGPSLVFRQPSSLTNYHRFFSSGRNGTFRTKLLFLSPLDIHETKCDVTRQRRTQ